MAENEIDFGDIGEAEPGGRGGLIWLVLFAVVAVGGGIAGVLASGLVVRPQPEGPLDVGDLDLPAVELPMPVKGDEFAYYDIQTITVTLRTAPMNRYLRATIKLAMRSKDLAAVKDYLDRKKPEIQNWLTLHLSDLTLQDVSGRKMLDEQRRKIRDGLNQELWPNSRPVIGHILLEEFAVQ